MALSNRLAGVAVLACSLLSVGACKQGGGPFVVFRPLESELVMPAGESRTVTVETEGSDWVEDSAKEMRVTMDLESEDPSIARVTRVEPEFHDLTPGLVHQTEVTIECVGEGETVVRVDGTASPSSGRRWERDRINVSCFVDEVTTGTTGEDTMTPTEPGTTGEDTMTPMTDESGGSDETGAMPSCRTGEATAPDSEGLILLEGTHVQVPIGGDQDECPTMGCPLLITNGHFAELTVSITPFTPTDSPRPEQSLIHIPTGEVAEVSIVVEDCINPAEDLGKSACFFDDLNGLSFGCIDLELASVLE